MKIEKTSSFIIALKGTNRKDEMVGDQGLQQTVIKALFSKTASQSHTSPFSGERTGWRSLKKTTLNLSGRVTLLLFFDKKDGNICPDFNLSTVNNNI
jgi:hypothetical protein